MALLTDDCDIRTTYLRTYLGGNGDYYVEIINVDEARLKTPYSVRISTSGGNSSTEVKVAIAHLHRAMVSSGFNEYPDE